MNHWEISNFCVVQISLNTFSGDSWVFNSYIYQIGGLKLFNITKGNEINNKPTKKQIQMNFFNSNVSVLAVFKEYLIIINNRQLFFWHQGKIDAVVLNLLASIAKMRAMIADLSVCTWYMMTSIWYDTVKLYNIAHSMIGPQFLA